MGLPSIPPPPPRISQREHERRIQDARDERARIRECVCTCGREWEEGARFCDACGVSLGYTGKTERLEQGNQGPPLRYPREVSGGVFK